MDWYDKARVIKGKRGKRSAAPLLRRLITAGGISRIFRHLKEGPFAIVSAARPEKTPEQNARDFAELKRRIVEDGLGFYPADGFFEGLPEDSIFIPGASLEKAIEYGGMFDPPQYSVMWGDEGRYGFYGIEDGRYQFGGDVGEDFTILKDEEVRKLIEEKSEIGFTEIGRGGQRPWTTDPSIKKWREKEKREELEDEAEERKVACVISDPRRHMAMGNYQGVYKFTGVDGKYVNFDDKRLKSDSIEALLAFIPMG